MSPAMNETWTAALADVVAERRAELLARYGEEDLGAFAAGTLPENQADELRELLALHPELEDWLEDGEQPTSFGPGHPARLSRTEQEAGWRDLATRLGLGAVVGEPPGRRPAWRLLVPLAAGLVAVGLGLALQSGRGGAGAGDYVSLAADRPSRGGESPHLATVIEPAGDEVRLALELPRSATAGERFRVVVYDIASAEDVWVGESLAPDADGFLRIRVPLRRMTFGEYRLEVQAAPAASPIALYFVRLP
jgi:hypothetical protein